MHLGQRSRLQVTGRQFERGMRAAVDLDYTAKILDTHDRAADRTKLPDHTGPQHSAIST